MYTINPTTGAATQVGAAGAFTLNGTAFGFDFNPVVDRIRVVSDVDQNFRLNPNDGTLVSADTALIYAAGDANAGQNPNVVGSAYTNNVAGAAATTLFGIDSNLDILVRQGSTNGTLISANSGQLFTVGALGVNTANLVGFDISGATGIAYASLTAPGSGGLPALYRRPDRRCGNSPREHRRGRDPGYGHHGGMRAAADSDVDQHRHCHAHRNADQTATATPTVTPTPRRPVFWATSTTTGSWTFGTTASGGRTSDNRPAAMTRMVTATAWWTSGTMASGASTSGKARRGTDAGVARSRPGWLPPRGARRVRPLDFTAGGQSWPLLRAAGPEPAVPLIPEADGATLLIGGLLAFGTVAEWRRRRAPGRE